MSSSLYRKTKLLLPEHLCKISTREDEQKQRQESEQKQRRSNDVLVSSSLSDRDENENDDSRYVTLPSESSEVGVDEYFQSISGMVSICHTVLSKDPVA